MMSFSYPLYLCGLGYERKLIGNIDKVPQKGELLTYRDFQGKSVSDKKVTFVSENDDKSEFYIETQFHTNYVISLQLSLL